MNVDIGSAAPDFTLPNQHGEPITLSQFRGDRNVVLVFYSWAFTGACTSELCEIRDRIATFDNASTTTLAVSCDAKFSLRIFAEREAFSFSLLSDFWPHGEVARQYDVFNDTVGAAMRGTFIIDRDGIVRYRVINAIPDVRDPSEYEKVLADLGSASAG